MCYFWLDPKVTKRSRLNRSGYSGQRLRCRLRNSLRSDSAGSCRFAFTLRLTPARLGLSEKAPLSFGIADTTCPFAAPCQARGQAWFPRSRTRCGIAKKQAVLAIPRGSGAPFFRPKLVSVKRRDRSERPERLLFERSEFQTRQRTEGTE